MEVLSYCRDFLRTIAVTVWSLTHEQRNLSARRGIANYAETGDSTARQQEIIRTLVAAVTTADYAGKVSALLRTIRKQAASFGEAGHLGDYLRCLYTETGNMAETKHEGEYYREVEDTVGSTALSLWHVLIFIRLVTLSLVRDYLLFWFLRSREELVIKSPVARDIILESRAQ